METGADRTEFEATDVKCKRLDRAVLAQIAHITIPI
jgi:hypothetical protein